LDRQAYLDEIKFKLSGGGILNLELDDTAFNQLLDSSFREIQRYIDTTKLITIPYKQCIDLTEYRPNSVSRVYRSTGTIRKTYKDRMH
jgi:hypothetical protein